VKPVLETLKEWVQRGLFQRSYAVKVISDFLLSKRGRGRFTERRLTDNHLTERQLTKRRLTERQLIERRLTE
jgi:hypothetical protein